MPLLSDTNEPHAIIKVSHVQVELGGKAVLQDITMNLVKSRITGIIGPSGAGKTTLIRCVVGRQRLANGSITIDDQPAGSPGLRSQLGYMPQDVSLYNDLTVNENLGYFATMRGANRKAARTMIADALDMVDMRPQAGQIAARLSGGQRQRLSLAIALLGSPQLLILDEPTVGLDPVLREQLWLIFRRLATHGATIVLSSHAMDEAGRCDDLALIRDAELLAHGSPHALCQQTGSRTVEESFLRLVGARR